MAPTPLIIDTDPGVDDVLAILLALASPDEVSVKAITLTFGNTTLDHAHANILRTAAVLQRHLGDPSTSDAVKHRFRKFSPESDPIIVATGSTKPLDGQMFTASYFHGRDGLSGVHWLPDDPFPVPEEAPAPLQTSEKHAADVMLDVLRQNEPGTVRIAALGPLTNLAAAFRKDPETFARVGAISVMGGAFDCPGNTTPCAEFNWYADPYSVKVLIDEAPNHPALAGRRLPLEILPLDLTSSHTVPYSCLVKVGDELANASPLVQYMSAFLTHPRAFTNNMVAPEEFQPDMHDLFQAHDPLAIAHSIFVPVGGAQGTGWTHKERHFQIETSGDLTRGFCVIDRRESSKTKKVGGNRAHDAKASEEQEDNEDSNYHTIENPDIPVHKKQKTETNGSTDSSTAAPSQAGWVDQVTASPGQEWFARIFLERLGL